MSSQAHVLVALRRALKKEADNLKELISTGGCNNFETYYRKVGQIEGLVNAERILVEEAQKAIKEEFEDAS